MKSPLEELRVFIERVVTLFHWLSSSQARRKSFLILGGLCYCSKVKEFPLDI